MLDKGGVTPPASSHPFFWGRQQALGEVQDSRITSDLLARLGSDAPTKRDAYVFGVLWHTEESASDSASAALLPKVR